MANDLLITAIRESGLTIDEIADAAGVDPRTAQRWLAGRIPHPRYRHKLATTLDVAEQDLWPDTTRARGKDGLREITGAWAQRNDPDAPDWRALLRGAERQIDLIGYSLLDIAQARGTNKVLVGKARDGCRVRIALADPDSDHVQAADLRQRPPGRLTDRIKDAHRRLQPLAAEPGIEVRVHDVASSHTILRFDDQLLLTIHLYGTPGFQAPLLHLKRDRDYGIYDQLTKHIEDLWQASAPIGNAGGAQVDSRPSARNADDLLDQLDHVWRPDR